MSLRNVSILPHLTRREALGRMGSGFGLVGLAGLVSGQLQADLRAMAGGP